MDLTNISIKLKPRNGYAAIDLGVRMAQKNWRLMTATSLILTLPIYLLLLILFPEHPLWVVIAIWWFKPIWERPLLLILSQQVFHQSLSLGQVLIQSLKLLPKQLIQSISWRRFSPTRSFDAPVMQLENLSGQARSQRLSALHSRSSSSISGLTFALHLVEELMAFGLMLFILQFIPLSDIEWTLFIEQLIDNTGLNIYYLLWSISWYLTMIIVAPFYVAGGFSSYLNQRSLREAWDLELVFRQLASKHKNQKFDYQKLTLSLVFACFLLPLTSLKAAEDINSATETIETIQQPDPFSQDKRNTKNAINKIQQGPDYKRMEQTTVFRLINSSETEKDNPKENSSFKFDSSIASLLAWLTLGLMVAYFLYKLPVIIEYFQNNLGNGNTQLGDKQKPEKLFGLDLSQEALPDDIVTEAIELWQQGQARAALSLLYQASLSRLIHNFNCDFEDGFTELECSHIVKQQQPAIANYFSKLTQVWRLLAYGHQLPQENLFMQLANNWQANLNPVTNTDEEGNHD